YQFVVSAIVGTLWEFQSGKLCSSEWESRDLSIVLGPKYRVSQLRTPRIPWVSKLQEQHGPCCLVSWVVSWYCGNHLHSGCFVEIDSQHFASPDSNRVVAAAKVCEIAHESPSVKSLRLLVPDKDFSFKAGQCPQLLEQDRIIELACTLDSEVALRVGGEFFFDPQPTDAPRNLVLIAGGVGINPLLSILRHSADLHRDQADKASSYAIGTIKLFYSAKNTSELLFKTTQISAELKPYITEGRITEKEIRDHVSPETLFYICGPPPMTDFFSKQLENSHVPKEHICFEKWW
ncbi:hypothetical protein A6R68_19798, partial [Neotoma lepida]